MMDSKFRYSHLCQDRIRETVYSAAIFAVGYEKRSRYLAQRELITAEENVVLAFQDRHKLAFDSNMRFYQRNAYRYVEASDDSFEQEITTILAKSVHQAKGTVRICVDISSLTRLRMATFVKLLLLKPVAPHISVDFVYCLGKFRPARDEAEPMVTTGPMLPEFAGWSIDPRLPTAAVIGLGYEPDKAVGSFEYVEASDLWVLVPSSTEVEYDDAIQKANRSLLKVVNRERVLMYRVDQPFSTLVKIESLVAGARRKYRLILLPFGPKILALITLILGAHYRDVSVWRVSAGRYGTPVDREANGEIVGLRVEYDETS